MRSLVCQWHTTAYIMHWPLHTAFSTQSYQWVGHSDKYSAKRERQTPTEVQNLWLKICPDCKVY